ncbi:MAG TPA: hypothetical protein VFP56_04370 [Candidatus Limnocylindrales bacterium]|nr:hypothetical protein [Candidatus Limnocylindrales bacterium]
MPPAKLPRHPMPAVVLALASFAMVALSLAPAAPSVLAAHASGSPADISPAPGAGGLFAADATSLAARLDHLPIVTSPDALPDDFLATASYGRATVGETTEIAQMYTASMRALSVPDDARRLVDEMLRLLDEPEDVAKQATGVEVTFRLATDALRGDSLNADRLNNAAVAMWSFGVVEAIDGSDEDNWYFQFAAIRLLEAATLAFPDHRPLLLNLAFLKATTADLELTGGEEAGRLLQRDPGDLTARALLASIQSRRGDVPDGAERALATIQPMLDDPATAALGEALAGDAHLAVASVRRAVAPTQARREAGLALAAYDRAAGLSADPEIQAGRSRALELLGDLQGAAAAQAMAAAEQGSMDLDIDLARLSHRTNDLARLGSLADSLVDRVLDGWDPSLASVRYVVATSFVAERVPEDRGFLGWSIGSASDHVPVTPFEEILGGGPGVVTVDTVDLDFPGVDHEIAVNLAPRSAWRLALIAAILDGDDIAAQRLDDEWKATVTWDAFWRDYVDAARISAGGTAAFDRDLDLDALDVAQRAFVRAGRPADAAELCRRLEVLACAGTNALRASEPGALDELRGAFEAAETRESNEPLSELRMLIAAAAEQAGDTATMEAFLTATAGADDAGALRVRAALKLGDLRLGAAEPASGDPATASPTNPDPATADPAAAVTWYELALATIEANNLATIESYTREAALALELRGLQQVARNNRGVALLRALQPDDATAPPCSDEALRPRCEVALADFTAAAESDPANAVYRMNVGWAARLLDLPEEARGGLKAAVALDPALYPAFNDLGVLLARSGDDAGARSAFEAAVAASPAYDLASWNLGILALRDLPGGIVEGQRRLAAAIRADPSLRTAPLDFRTDERTYTFRFEAPLPQSEGLPLGRTYSLGAVVLAGVTSIAALAQLQATLVGHGLETAADSARGWLERQGRRARWRARQRSMRRRVPRTLRGWLPWLGIVVVLALASGWQAAQASPAAAGAAITLALFAGVIALVAHGIGHWIGARSVGGRVIPAAWTPGAIVALLFVPVQAASGPFFAERLRMPAGGHAGAWRFHLAGPLANLIVGVAAYLLFLAAPAPVFRLLAQVQLAAIAYTLLPVQPLDGWAIKREHPRLLVVLGFGVVAAGSAFALGIL